MQKIPLSSIYSYEEYQVLTVLEKLVPDEENLRPEEMKDFAVPPDFYVSKGIEALELKGKTLVQTKQTLSFPS